jgi:hypothetical protein
MNKFSRLDFMILPWKLNRYTSLIGSQDEESDFICLGLEAEVRVPKGITQNTTLQVPKKAAGRFQ